MLSNLSPRDRLFVVFLGGACVVMVLFGCAALVLAIVSHPSDAVIFRTTAAFGAMFSGWMGTVTGYLLGRKSDDE